VVKLNRLVLYNTHVIHHGNTLYQVRFRCLTNIIINEYVKFFYGVITRSNKTLSYCHHKTTTGQYFHSLYLIQRKYLRSALKIHSFSVWGLNAGIKARFNEPSPYVLNTHKLYFKTLRLYYVYPAHKSH
jgi:hypothetical protein